MSPHVAITPHQDQPLALGLAKLWHARSPVVLSANQPRPSLLDRLLAARGFSNPTLSHDFLNPSLKHLHDPSSIPDLDRAAARILAALRNAEPVVIYGDYDVDGITASAILWHTLRAIAPEANISTYVPHRIDEGYGLSAPALLELANAGAKVVVSVDCGITAIAPAQAAKAAGLDLIITDHHNPPAPGQPLPDAYAIVHPRRADSTYPFGELSGAGVAYKLAWRLATLSAGSDRATEPVRRLLIELLALASLGTVADVVPLLGENRVICRFGLSRIQNSTNVGLRALVEASGLAGENVNAQDVGFKLGPRLNACGRLGHAAPAVEMLTTATPQRARQIAAELTAVNEQRRATERAILLHAIQLVEAAGMHTPDRRAIVLAHENWHPGVVGIVCSKLVEKYNRPTLLLNRQGPECHGSGRSIPGFKLADALRECTTLLTSHGGHDMAAGLRLPSDALDRFTHAFTEIANASIAPERLVGSLTVDTDATLDELTPDSIAALEAFAPFGQGNPPVRVRLTDVTLCENPSPFGNANTHVSLRLRDANAERAGVPRRSVRVVAWGWAERARELRAGQRADVVVTPAVSRWNGSTTVEPTLHDLRILTP